jgi:hypothetical protein
MKSPRNNKVPAAVALTLASLFVALSPAPAMAAKKGKKAAASNEVVGLCVTNYKSGLENEQVGHLLQARELFIRCAKAACGSPLREECTTRFTQLSTDIPSVVPMVTDENGGPRTDVEVKVDGERLTTSLDGHSLVLDPGVREFSFSKDGRVFATQKLMIVQGQRNRLISASAQMGAADTKRTTKAQPMKKIAAPTAVVAQASDDSSDKTAEAAPVELTPRKIAANETAQQNDSAPEVNLTTEPKSGGHSAFSYVLGGVGLASVGAAGALIYWARKDNDNLSTCSVAGVSNCPQGAVDHIHKMYLAGNIALGVGVASLGAAYWVYTHSGKESAKEEAYRFDVQPTKSGAMAGVSGSF